MNDFASLHNLVSRLPLERTFTPDFSRVFALVERGRIDRLPFDFSDRPVEIFEISSRPERRRDRDQVGIHFDWHANHFHLGLFRHDGSAMVARMPLDEGIFMVLHVGDRIADRLREEDDWERKR